MTYKNKLGIAIFVLVLAFCMLSFGVFADDGYKVMNNESFTSSLGIVKAANAGGHGQSAMALKAGVDGGKYAVFYPTLTGNNPGHSFAEVKYTDLYLESNSDAKYFILEMDIATETQYVNYMEFEFIGKNTAGSSVFGSTKPSIRKNSGGEWFIYAPDGYKLEQERGVWQHITFVIELSLNNANGTGSCNSKIYTYHNGVQIGSGKLLSNDAVYLHSLRISYLNGKPVNSTDIFCMDNLKTTKITSSYTGNLSEILADSERSLTEFDLSNYKTGYTFPKAAAIARIGGKSYSTASDISAAVKPGDEIVVVGNIYDKITIPCECSISNPNGFTFSYDANGYSVYESEKTVSFIEPFESVEVIWHIGDRTEKAVYNSPIQLIAPEYSETVDVGGVPCKAIGFAKSEGGEAISDLGFVSPYNKEFWLVYVEPIAYALHSDDTRAYAYSDSEFDSLINNSVDGDVITLFGNINTMSSFSISNKAITIDLGTFTLSMEEGGSGDMFIVGEGGSLTVKNGTIEAYRNGRIPIGSTSIARRRIFATKSVSSQLCAIDLVINACKMIAIIENGIALFERCEMDFTNDYENMIDLYSGNDMERPTTLNLKDCNIASYKTIVNVYKPGNVSNNNAVINAYNCNMKTPERVFATEAAGSVRVEGGKYDCKYLFGKLNTNTAATAFISEGTLLSCDVIDEKGKLILDLDGGKAARINNDEYPYTVTKDYAVISWVWPNSVLKETWKIGETPICPYSIPESTREMKYELQNISPVTKAQSYILSVTKNFKTKISLELDMDYSINFYISEMSLKSLVVDGIVYTSNNANLVNLNGETYYKFNTGKLSAEECVEDIPIIVKVPSAFGDKQFNYNVNVCGYLDDVLSGGYSYETYKLALSILGRIKQELPEDASNSRFENIVKKYNTDSVIVPIEKTESGISDISNAVTGAYITDSVAVAYRIMLNSEFSGAIKIAYTRGGADTERIYNVSRGKYGGKNYIDIIVPADAFATGIKITVGDAFGSVDPYLASNHKDGLSGNKLIALYSYSKQVQKYAAESEDN